MGRLFWKFLFSYWIALLVAIIGVGAASWLYGLTDADLTLEGGPRAAFLVSSAQATLHHGGTDALRALLDEWRAHGDAHLLAVDEAGQDLLGRPVPAAALERARILAESTPSSSVVRRVEGPGGGRLLFLPEKEAPLLRRILLPHGRPPPPWLPLLTGTVASLLFGSLLALYVARPIRHLRQAFAAVSEGRLETRIGSLIGRRRDEVADLGRDFDAMAQRVQALVAAQRSLLHDVSHELRSPLARLQAAIGLARQSPDRLLDSLGRIEREADRLDDLVGELLTLARLEAQVQGVERAERIDLVDLVAAISADADFEAQASNRFVVFQGEGEVLANVDAELLHRAVENVVRNAVRFTAEGTTVRVSVARMGDDAVLTVTDQGPGVPSGELEAIFEPFFRGSHTGAGMGFGLGLAIARRAILAHRGRIEARNGEEGGLVVELHVPVGSGGGRA